MILVIDMLNESILKKYPQLFGYPQEFYDFLYMCDVNPFNIEKLNEQNYVFDYERFTLTKSVELLTTYDQTNNDFFNPGISHTDRQYNIAASWISDIKYDKVIKRIDELKEEKIDDFFYTSSLSSKELFDHISWKKRKVNELQQLYNTKVPSGFEGHIVTSDLAIVLKDNLVQAMLTPQTGEFIILYGELDENKKLRNITISSYDNILDFSNDNETTYLRQNINPEGYPKYEPIVDCNSVMKREKILESNGILPNKKINLDFKQFLSEIDMQDMYEKPIAAIYQAKESIIEKIIEKSKYKK